MELAEQPGTIDPERESTDNKHITSFGNSKNISSGRFLINEFIVRYSKRVRCYSHDNIFSGINGTGECVAVISGYENIRTCKRGDSFPQSIHPRVFGLLKTMDKYVIGRIKPGDEQSPLHPCVTGDERVDRCRTTYHHK